MSDTDQKRFGVYLWCTWLATALSGDRKCEFAHWYKAHFKFAKLDDGSFNLEGWRADHDAAVRKRADALAADGWRLRLESMSKFNVKGQTATIGGQCDIVAMRDDQIVVEDLKRKRRDSDWWQVLIYLLMLPKAFKEEMAGKRMSGRVLYYGDSSVREVDDAAVERDGPRVYARIREIAGRVDPPPRSPSAHECRFCDIAVCTDRVREGEQEAQAGVADEF